MRNRGFLFFTLAILGIGWAAETKAWGPEGHRIVGHLAYELADAEAAAAVRTILGTDTDESTREALAQACFWPDVVRDTAGTRREPDLPSP